MIDHILLFIANNVYRDDNSKDICEKPIYFKYEQ